MSAEPINPESPVADTESLYRAVRNDPHEQAYGEIIAENYRKQGFKL